MAYNKNGKQYDNTYMDAAFNVEELNIQVNKLSLSFWGSPDGAVSRCYVSGKAGNQWTKLGWISNDRIDCMLGDLDDMTRDLVVLTAKKIIADKTGKPAPKAQPAQKPVDEVENAVKNEYKVKGNYKKVREAVGE